MEASSKGCFESLRGSDAPTTEHSAAAETFLGSTARDQAGRLLLSVEPAGMGGLLGAVQAALERS